MDRCFSSSYPLSRFPTLEGVVRDSSGTSSISLSGLGDFMWNVWTMEIEGEFEDPLKLELMGASLYMILKDGHFVTQPDHDRVTHLGRGVEVVTLRDPNKEALILHEQFKLSKEEMPHLQIIVAGEVAREKPPWVNKKFLWIYKSMGVSIEGFKEDILRILMEIEIRCCTSKPKVSKMGTISYSRKDRE